jgi:hypothetical protein
MEYNEARVKALETEVFNLNQKIKQMQSELDYFKRNAVRRMISDSK